MQRDRDMDPMPRREGIVRGDPRSPVRRRTSHRRGGAGQGPPQGEGRGPGLAVLGILLALIGFPILLLATAGGQPAASPAPTAPDASPRTGPGSLPAPTGDDVSPETSGAATEGPSAPVDRVALVPVVARWSSARDLTLDALKAALTSGTYAPDGGVPRPVIVPAADRDAIAATLGVTLAPAVDDASVAVLRRRIQDREGTLGLLRVTDVTPALRALAIDGADLFGVGHVPSIDAWPLTVPAGQGASAWDPAATWTMVGVGDILLDRGVALQVKILDKGVDFPYDGGRARITGSRCCSGRGRRVPLTERTGGSGAVRGLTEGADLALANLESPVDDNFVFHSDGTTFSGDPALLEGIQRAGFDFTSLANNHIRDAGRDGVLETIQALDGHSIAHSGAGADFAAARLPALLRTHGLTVAVFGCDDIAPSYWTHGDRVGSRECDTTTLVADIRAARGTADLVVVYPHWGVEYTSAPTIAQRTQAGAWIGAGADLIIGNHPHWAGAVEEIDGKPVFYALGNFVFDQDWSEPTMEGLVLEMTFQGRRLMQTRLLPTIILDKAQPNLLEPDGGGDLVMSRVREASQRLLPRTVP